MRLRHIWLLAAAGFALLVAAAPARAALLIEVDKAAQKMTVSVNGQTLHVWPVSTGIADYDTPSGDFKPFRMEKDHFSREWDDAPMPYSIFFTQQGHAIHGSYHKSIGRPASHGCVRLEPKNAAALWDLVKQEKMANTRVVLTGEIPTGDAPAVARRQPRDRDYERRYSAGEYFDDDVTASAPPQRRQRDARGWREYNDGPRYYYYRDRPYDERRVYRNAPPPLPFGW